MMQNMRWMRWLVAAVSAGTILCAVRDPSFAQHQLAWPQVQHGIVVVGYENTDGTFQEYGTAFCIHSDSSGSEFLTVDHVVHPKQPNLKLVVRLPDGMNAQSIWPVTVVRFSSSLDLAVVSITLANVHPLKLSSTPPQSSQPVAVGGFGTLEGVSVGGLYGAAQQLPGVATHLAPGVHMGAVSSVFLPYVAFDLGGGSVDEGNSGGPLFDPSTGTVYGVVEGYVAGHDTGHTAEGYALSSAYASLAISRDVVDAFVDHQQQTIPGVDVAAFSGQKTSATNPHEAGNADAQNALGLRYENGQGVTQNYATALHWYQLAAAAGNADAEYNVGRMYGFGYGVPQNYATALHWLKLSADEGNAAGENGIGFAYALGYGVTQDYAQALHSFTLAADKGNSNAQLNIGLMYHNGRGVTQDYANALHWYGLAAAQGNVYAEINIGAMYGFGQGVTQDYPTAMHWLQLAAASGNADAEFDIGFMYAKGLGVPQDYATALHWFRLAAAGGNAKAATAVARLSQLQN